MKEKIAALVRLGLFALLLFSAQSSGLVTPDVTPDVTPNNVTPDNFLHAEGQSLLVGDKPTRLRAINFSNFYNDPSLNLSTSLHHSEVDFRRVKRLGFNAIRFAFNGHWYENDTGAFWRWLDQNINWARKHNIYLILDLHVPIDSFWLAANSSDVKFDIWSNPDVQKRNIDLWRSIAERYKNEPIIAGYDILNEPVTADKNGKQWQQLANKLVNAIREVDRNHLIVVERLYGTEGTYGTNDAQQQFLINDDNILYDFHFYEPMEYTHQYASWLAHPVGDGGRYPDMSRLYPTGLRQPQPATRISGPAPTEIHTDWREYKSERIQITESDGGNLIGATPVLTVQGVGSGRVYFDDIRVFEYDSTGKFLGEVLHAPISADSVWHWWQWPSAANTPEAVKFERQTETGKNDASSLAITLNDVSNEELYTWNNSKHWLKIKPGNSYQLSVYLKTAGYTESAPKAYLGLDIYDNSPANNPVLLTRDRAYLEHKFLEYYQFGIDNNVPVSVLETGLMQQTFAASGKGGTLWARDMLDIFKQYNTSFGWWHYHSDQMGLYLSGQQYPPANVNQALAEVFTDAHAEFIDALHETPGQRLEASSAPPGYLPPEQVPQFVTIGFDDNTIGAGIDWAMSLFEGRSNPDGSPARASFYMNTHGLSKRMLDDPEILIAGIKRLASAGHEIGNHTHNHQSDIDRKDWKRFEKTMATMGPQDWGTRIEQCPDSLQSLAGIPKSAVKGFRAPYLRYNQNMLSALSDQGFSYDTSIEDGHAPYFDGTNFRWPYTLDNGSPGHNEGWNGSTYNPNQIILDSTPALWEFPVHVLLVPDDVKGKAYGITPGLWERIKNKLPNLRHRRISGLDYNLFVSAGLTGKEVTAILKYNLDLRLQGNRAPMMFTAHSQYYVSQQWLDGNAPHLTLTEMQGAIAEFIDYAMSKPEVRLRPAIDVIEWCKQPEAL